MREVVTHRHQVAHNIRAFQAELRASPDLQRRLGNVHAWYALEDKDAGWIFAPSKFVSYAGNTAGDYVRTARAPVDGRETEAVLRKWFTPLEPDSARARMLRDRLATALAAYGRSPRRDSRISVVVEQADPGRPPQARADTRILDRIAIDPAVCGGRPHIRGTRMRVSDIVDMLASGAQIDEILEDFPYLAAEDIAAALAYAARATDHRVILAA